MARIRTIKPEFWTSSQVADCSHSARLLFIGMWNFADDGGVLPYKPRDIRAKIFPADDDVTSETVRRLIGELLEAELLFAYEAADGEKYLSVTGWKHQKIEKPNFRYPKPPSEIERKSGQMSLPIPDQIPNRSPINRRSIADQSPPEGKGRESNGREGNGGASATDPGPNPKSEQPPAPPPDFVLVIKAFDDARAEAFGEAQRRSHPHQDDGSHAKRFLTSGATVQMCADVFRAICHRTKDNGKRPPWSLEYFEAPIADAIAAASKPMPAPRPINGTTPHVEALAKPTKDDVRKQMKARADMIAKGQYLSSVVIQDVRHMIEAGWITAEQAETAGYVL